MVRNTFASWTEASVNSCLTPIDSSRTRPQTSLEQETDFKSRGVRDSNPMDDTLTSKRHHDSVFSRNAFQENGYGSSPDKQRNDDARHCLHEHNSHGERPRNLESPAALESLPKGDGGRIDRDEKDWKIKAPSPAGVRDCDKTGSSHSEVTKVVPLKPQRSKKCLNTENKGVVNRQTQSRSDGDVFGAAGDVQTTKSKDASCEAERRLEDNTLLQSATDVVKENTAAAKNHSEAAMLSRQQTLIYQQMKNELFGQQELRDCSDATGQNHWARGGGGVLHEDHFQSNSDFKENLFSGSKFPTAPPRTLPLKTQWSRDRQSNMDNSHIHYRTPGQESARKKQAVNHLPPPPPPSHPYLSVNHRKVKHCMSFRRCRANLVFNHLKTKQKTNHVTVNEKAKSPRFLRIASLTDSIHVHGPGSSLLFPLPPPPPPPSAKLDICLAISEPHGPLSKLPIA